MNHDPAHGAQAPDHAPDHVLDHALDHLLVQAWRVQDAAAGTGTALGATGGRDEAFVARVMQRLPPQRPAPAAAPLLDARAALGLLRRRQRQGRRAFGLEAAGAAAGTLVLALSLPALPAAADPLRLGMPLALGTLALALALLLPSRG